MLKVHVFGMCACRIRGLQQFSAIVGFTEVRRQGLDVDRCGRSHILCLYSFSESQSDWRAVLWQAVASIWSSAFLVVFLPDPSSAWPECLPACLTAWWRCTRCWRTFLWTGRSTCVHTPWTRRCLAWRTRTPDRGLTPSGPWFSSAVAPRWTENSSAVIDVYTNRLANESTLKLTSW